MFSIIRNYSLLLLLARLIAILTPASCSTSSSADNSLFPTTYEELKDIFFQIIQSIMSFCQARVPLPHLHSTDEMIQTLRMIENAATSTVGSENNISRYFVAFALAFLLTTTLTWMVSVTSKLVWKLMSIWIWMGKWIIILAITAKILSLGD